MGNQLMSGWAQINLGRVAYAQGDLARALPLFEETRALFQNLDYRDGVANVLLHLARVAHVQGDDTQARERLVESLALCRQTGNLLDTASCLEGLAGVATACAQPERAARLFGVAAALRESVGLPLSPVLRADYEHEVFALRAEIGDEAFAAAWAAGQAMTLEQAIAEAVDDAAISRAINLNVEPRFKVTK